MFELFGCSRFNLKIGKAKEAKLIRGTQPYNQELLCVPIHIKIYVWEAKRISAKVKSGESSIDSILYDKNGLSSFNDEFDLTYEYPYGWVALAFKLGRTVYIGNPIINEPLRGQAPYPIRLELHCKNTLVLADFILTEDMRLLSKGEDDNATS